MILAGHDPRDILDWPLWIFSVLADYWPALEAERTLTLVTASAAPHAKRDQYRGLVERLTRQRRAIDPPAARITVERVDPAAARAWFGEAGYEVVHSG